MDTGLSDILSSSGAALLKEGQQNCVVLYNNHIYIHPKVRCVMGEVKEEVLPGLNPAESGIKGRIGINHSSLSHGRQVCFAGSIVQASSNSWIIENTSGHYITRAFQIKALLNALKERGMDLSKLMVKLWISNNPKIILPVLSESDFTVLLENAEEYMNRMSNSQTRYG